jgi:hypothetical protein
MCSTGVKRFRRTVVKHASQTVDLSFAMMFRDASKAGALVNKGRSNRPCSPSKVPSVAIAEFLHA